MKLIPSPPERISDRFNLRSAALVAVCLAILTLAVYWKIQHHAFLVWDDYEYIVENPHVRTGLRVENLAWAMTSAHAGNWHPLTWISHMLDCDLYGLNPAGHHLNNLLLHLINAILLLILLGRMTGALWQSAFVAAVLALHPLHVESVAWVSERKDLLSAFFFMLTCLAYVQYTRKSGLWRYILCMALFALGLASKPMLVTLPVVLLLLDYWPLARSAPPLSAREKFPDRIPFAALFIEKLPFFALSGLSSLITLYASNASHAVGSIDIVPLWMRIGNGVVSYSMYLIKAFAPMDLAFFYPHPLGALSVWKMAAASLFLVVLSLMVFILRKRQPFLLMGWLWYGITLLPVIGLIQVGSQAWADRYAYIPLIGISIMIVWGLSHVLRKGLYRAIASGLGLTVILLLSLSTSKEAGYWENGERLFGRALQVTTGNYTAHYQLGNEYVRQGRMESAIRHFSEAVRFRPDHFLALRSLGLAEASLGRFDQAMAHLRTALNIQPKDAGTLASIGDVLLMQGDTGRAGSYYLEALKIDPSLWRVQNNLGLAFLRSERVNEAIVHFEEALRLNPEDPKARRNLDFARRKIQLDR